MFSSQVLQLVRMFTLGVVAALQECFGYGNRGILILMYHSISDDLVPVVRIPLKEKDAFDLCYCDQTAL